MAGDTDKVTEVVVEEVKIVEVSSLISNRNNLYQFMRAFLCLHASPKPNTLIKFRLADVSKPPLASSLSPLKLSTWANLLLQYLRGFKVHFPMILRFGAELGYKGPSNVFILSDNLASALKDPTIIEKKLQEDLALGRIVYILDPPSPPFISLPLGLVPKHDGKWQKIHHFSHSCGELVNDYIPDGAGEMKHIRFQEVLQLVTRAGRHCIILKKVVKDAFENIPVALQHQWLLEFR